MSNSLNQNFKTLSLLKFALPSMIMMVFMSLYTIIDGIFVSRLVGESALSAVNIVWPVICILIAIGVMLATGGSAVVARKMGEGDEKGACENFTFLAVVGVAVSLVLLVIVLLFHKPIVYALGADDSLFENGKTYLIYMMYFGPFISVLLCNCRKTCIWTRTDYCRRCSQCSLRLCLYGTNAAWHCRSSYCNRRRTDDSCGSGSHLFPCEKKRTSFYPLPLGWKSIVAVLHQRFF